MTAPGALGMVSVDAALLERGKRVLDETRFVKSVGMDRHLDIVAVGNAQAVVDGRRCGAPVLVEIESHGTGLELGLQRLGQAGVALAEKADVHGHVVHGLEHLADMPLTGRTSGRVGAGSRTGATAQHGGDAAHQGLFHQLGADEVDMGVERSRREDLALSGDDLGARADDDLHIRLSVRVAGLADGRDAPGLEAHICLDDAPPVEDQGVGDHGVHHAIVMALTLPHAIAYHLATTELHLVTVMGGIALHLDP